MSTENTEKSAGIASIELDKLIQLYEKGISERNEGNFKVERVRYELFRDYFLPMLDKDVDIEKRQIIRMSWIKIARGPFNKTYLVDSDDNVVLTVPPIMDYLSQIDKNKSSHSEYEYATKRDANLDLGAKDKVISDIKIHGINDGFEYSWANVIKFFNTKEENVKDEEEDVGYDLWRHKNWGYTHVW